jgi:transcriptional regulator with GAF, ATPase, and Fis domain
VNIAAMPETLVESELFGYEKGAFTGADRQKIGLVELAHQGTLFIDEIGEIPQNIQAKLLRLFQEKSFMRIGGTKTITSDFRLLTATNRNLKQEVASGRFREDLYYRLNLLEFSIPPLRQRPEDILLLARHFLSHYAKKYNRSKLVLTPDLETSLIEYDWPGNVRELKNVIERAVLIAEEDCVEFNFPLRQGSFIDDPFSDLPTMNEMQRRYLNYVFEKTGGLIGGPGGAAEILGMKRTTVNSRKKKLGIS